MNNNVLFFYVRSLFPRVCPAAELLGELLGLRVLWAHSYYSLTDPLLAQFFLGFLQ